MRVERASWQTARGPPGDGPRSAPNGRPAKRGVFHIGQVVKVSKKMQS